MVPTLFSTNSFSLWAFYAVKKHYTAVSEQLRITGKPLEPIKGNIVIVPVAGVTSVVEKSIQYAKTLSDQVIAVHVTFNKGPRS